MKRIWGVLAGDGRASSARDSAWACRPAMQQMVVWLQRYNPADGAEPAVDAISVEDLQQAGTAHLHGHVHQPTSHLSVLWVAHIQLVVAAAPLGVEACPQAQQGQGLALLKPLQAEAAMLSGQLDRLCVRQQGAGRQSTDRASPATAGCKAQTASAG